MTSLTFCSTSRSSGHQQPDDLAIILLLVQSLAAVEHRFSSSLQIAHWFRHVRRGVSLSLRHLPPRQRMHRCVLVRSCFRMAIESFLSSASPLSPKNFTNKCRSIPEEKRRKIRLFAAMLFSVFSSFVVSSSRCGAHTGRLRDYCVCAGDKLALDLTIMPSLIQPSATSCCTLNFTKSPTLTASVPVLMISKTTTWPLGLFESIFVLTFPLPPPPPPPLPPFPSASYQKRQHLLLRRCSYALDLPISSWISGFDSEFVKCYYFKMVRREEVGGRR